MVIVCLNKYTTQICSEGLDQTPVGKLKFGTVHLLLLDCGVRLDQYTIIEAHSIYIKLMLFSVGTYV